MSYCQACTDLEKGYATEIEAHKRTQAHHETSVFSLEEQLASTRHALKEAQQKAATFQRMYDKCFKERDEERARWVLDPIHEQLRKPQGVSAALQVWKPIETAPNNDEMIVAWVPERGAFVISGRMLAIASLPQTPLHLQLRATHWAKLPELPRAAIALAERPAEGDYK